MSQNIDYIIIVGAGERIRTSDLLITNQLLCRLSYTGVMIFSFRLII